MIRSAAIEHLYCERNGANELVTFVLSRFDDSASLCAASVIKSILRQSLKPDDITEEVERQLSRLETSYAETDITETVIQYCSSRFTTLYIVIDSLDEFEKNERNILLQSLSSIISHPDSKVKLFLVGRSSVLFDIRKWFAASYEKSTDCREVQADIDAYVRESINLRKEGKLPLHEQLLLQDPGLAQEIIKALIDGANGMCVILLNEFFRAALLTSAGFSGSTTRLRRYADALPTMRFGESSCISPKI